MPPPGFEPPAPQRERILTIAQTEGTNAALARAVRARRHDERGVGRRGRALYRALEREGRKAKLEVAATPADSDERRAANRQIRDLQTKIRDHVAETGLICQRNREQPWLDNDVT